MNRSSITRKLVTTSRPALQGFLFGLLAAILLIVTDELSMRFGLSDSQRIVDDLLGGVIAGLSVFGYARARMRFIAERLNTVELMNHHIRNALQVIQHAGYIQPQSQQVAEVEEAIKRIEWALQEVLPGGITAPDQAWNPARCQGGLAATSHKAGK